jgi:hypothetical protein
MIWATRIGLCLIGLALFAAGALLYEDEEMVLQNRLEIWWVALDDMHRKAAAAEGIVLQRIFGATAKMLGAVFGVRFLSIKFALASLATSMLMFLALGFVAITFRHQPAPPGVNYAYSASVYIFIVVLLFALSRSGILGLIVALVPVCLLGWFMISQGQAGNFFGLGFGTAGSILTDALILAAIRRFLRNPPKRFLVPNLLVGSISLGLLSIMVPQEALYVLRFYSLIKVNVLVAFVAFLLLFNVSDFLFFFSVFVLACLVALHHLAWPTVKRSLYAVQRTSVFSYRKSLCATGIAVFLVGISWKQPLATSAFEAIKKLLGL